MKPLIPIDEKECFYIPSVCPFDGLIRCGKDRAPLALIDFYRTVTPIPYRGSWEALQSAVREILTARKQKKTPVD